MQACRGVEETGELTREVPFGKDFPENLVQFQLIPGLPGRENLGRQDASRNGLGLEGGRVKAEILKI